MGMDIWKIKYEKLHDHLSDEEYNFLERNSAMQDDGNYFIDKHMVDEGIQEITKEEKQEIQDMLDILETEFKKEHFEGFSFNIG